METVIGLGLIALLIIFFWIMGLKGTIQSQENELKLLRDTLGENNEMRSRLEEQQDCLDRSSNEMMSRLKQRQVELDSFSKEMQEYHAARETLLANMEDSKLQAFKGIASLIADYETLNFDISAKRLKSKKRPAKKEAQRIQELKKQAQAIIEENKQLIYRHEYLLKVFPDLRPYVEDLDGLEEMERYRTISELVEETDRARLYLSKEEYESLDEIERNQLALENYVKGRKSKWQIGRDYEMFVGIEYQTKGWDVAFTGIEMNLGDLGRDLVAKKDKRTHIVQCKYWSQHKQIHENTICQLFGTTVHYLIDNKLDKQNVYPVLVTNIELSDRAKEFAGHLGVHIITKALKPFPRIKCKAGDADDDEGEGIYHLPMDQQYDRTKINGEGDCYVMTVQEAVSKGFRRAYRWRGGVN